MPWTSTSTISGPRLSRLIMARVPMVKTPSGIDGSSSSPATSPDQDQCFFFPSQRRIHRGNRCSAGRWPMAKKATETDGLFERQDRQRDNGRNR